MTNKELQAIKERYTRDYGELPTAARADVPALVAEVERLRAELAAVPVAEICRVCFDDNDDAWEVVHAWADEKSCAAAAEWLAEMGEQP